MTVVDKKISEALNITEELEETERKVIPRPNGDDEKLPLNSFATDIFISDEECLLDINPQNLDFVTISNVKEWLIKIDQGVSLSKLKQEILKYCEVKAIDKVITKNQTKTVKGKKCKVWKKLKCLQEENFNEFEGQEPYFGN